MIRDVQFYDAIDDEKVRFAVILARFEGKWVFCKHRKRTTLEVPGGHREPGESVEEAAARELREETGAGDFTLRSLGVYCVVRDDREESFGGLYFAEITSFAEKVHSEIAEILLLEEPPDDNWTYPEIQPRLLEEARRRGAWTNPV